jgi:hypothetical protein
VCGIGIVKSTKLPDQAHELVDAFLDPEARAYEMRNFGYGSATKTPRLSLPCTSSEFSRCSAWGATSESLRSKQFGFIAGKSKLSSKEAGCLRSCWT